MSIVNVRQKYLLHPPPGQKSYSDLNEWMSDPNNLYIGMRKNSVEGSKWSNPFANSRTTLKKSLEMYKKHVLESNLNKQLDELVGKNLGCWCVTDTCEECHGNILIEILKEKGMYRKAGTSSVVFEDDEDGESDDVKLTSSQIAELNKKQLANRVKEIREQHPIDQNEKMDPQARDMILEISDVYDVEIGVHDPDIRGADYNEAPGNSVGLLEPDTSKMGKKSTIKEDISEANKAVYSMFDQAVIEQKEVDKEIKELANKDLKKLKDEWLDKGKAIFTDLEEYEIQTIVNSFFNKQFYNCSYNKDMEKRIIELMEN